MAESVIDIWQENTSWRWRKNSKMWTKVIFLPFMTLLGEWVQRWEFFDFCDQLNICRWMSLAPIGDCCVTRTLIQLKYVNYISHFYLISFQRKSVIRRNQYIEGLPAYQFASHPRSSSHPSVSRYDSREDDHRESGRDQKRGRGIESEERQRRIRKRQTPRKTLECCN